MRHRIGLRFLLAAVLVVSTSLADPPPPPAPAEPPVVPAPAAPGPRVTAELARGAIRAALHAAGFPEKFATLAGLATRARTSALAPELVLRATRSTDQSLRFTPTLDDPAHYSEAGGAGLWLEARLVWHFDRLVFDRDELSVERLVVDRADAAAKLTAKVLELLFAWHRARLRAEDEAADPADRAMEGLRAAELAVTLDILTGGWFEKRRLDR
ncbi:MAG TPA: hypothetical protein VHE30_28925 [Polyangiaceae bacterium]|nr:hypothetical protein [Polyangiaceae bacterium]